MRVQLCTCQNVLQKRRGRNHQGQRFDKLIKLNREKSSKTDSLQCKADGKGRDSQGIKFKVHCRHGKLMSDQILNGLEYKCALPHAAY